MTDVTGKKRSPRAFAAKWKIAWQSQMIEKWMKLFSKMRVTIDQFVGLGDSTSIKFGLKGAKCV